MVWNARLQTRRTVKYYCGRQQTSSWAQNAWHRRIFFSCTRDQRTCVGSRPNGQGHVDCLSPCAHQKPLIRLMFRGTLLDSQLSSPSPFSSFCFTPLLAQTPLLNASMSQRPCATPQGGLNLGRLAEQSPPQVMSPTLSSKSAVSTQWLHLKSPTR